VTGTSSAQLILIAISPILTRIYSPEDFAVLALFAAFAQVIGVVATGRYELAIYLPDSEEKARKLIYLCLYLSAINAAITLVIVALFREEIARLWNMPDLAPWLWLLPLAIFLSGAFAALQAASIRSGFYRIIASANVLKAAFQAALQLGLGFLIAGPAGLVAGRAFASAAAALRMLPSTNIRFTTEAKLPWPTIKTLLAEYKRFPGFSAPASLVNTTNANLMNFALPILLGATSLGLYSLAMRVLGAPIQQIAAPIGQVFMKEAAQEIRAQGNARKSFLYGLAALTAFSIVLFGVLALIAESVFAFVFGEEWRIAGAYAVLLMPLFATRFIVSPLSNMANLTDNRHTLFINLTLLLTGMIVLFIARHNAWEAEPLLQTMSLSLSAVYITYVPILYRLAIRGSQGESFDE
jgi:O-antigen/teichoic acid export membrane protein